MTVHNDPGVSRRDFLRTATLTAAAAVAAGGGTAWFLRSNETGEMAITVSEATVPRVMPEISAPPALDLTDEVAWLQQQLAAAQADNVTLRTQIDLLQNDLGSTRALEAESRTARDSTAQQLDAANNRIGVLAGLVALYDQLDQIDLGDVVENGLGAVGERLGELLDGAPDLVAGLDNGQLALAEMEAQIPLLENGRLWLDNQVARVETFYGEVEAWLQQAVERAGDFFELLADWFEGLRKWLPFGIGEKAAGVMGALTTLIATTPETVAGLNTHVKQPLDAWLAHEDGVPALQKRVVLPIRDEVITNARTAVDRAQQTGQTFSEQLQLPAQNIIASRHNLRQAIQDYKQQHVI